MARPDANRVQLSVRLDREDKVFFQERCEASGIEASVAARQLIELMVQRMHAGGDYIDALFELRCAWAAGKLKKRSNGAAKQDANG